MSRRLYNATLALARHRHATPALAGLAFVESSVFPIPPDVMLVPMMLAEPRRIWALAGLCTIASTIGALVGYAIGAYAWAIIGAPLLAFYGGGDAFAQFEAFYHSYGALVVLVAAVSFIPFKIATLASGVVAMPLPAFLLASLIGRGLRFFAIAALLYFFGKPIARALDRYFVAVSWGVIVLLVAGLLYTLN